MHIRTQHVVEQIERNDNVAALEGINSGLEDQKGPQMRSWSTLHGLIQIFPVLPLRLPLSLLTKGNRAEAKSSHSISVSRQHPCMETLTSVISFS